MLIGRKTFVPGKSVVTRGPRDVKRHQCEVWMFEWLLLERVQSIVFVFVFLPSKKSLHYCTVNSPLPPKSTLWLLVFNILFLKTWEA